MALLGRYPPGKQTWLKHGGVFVPAACLKAGLSCWRAPFMPDGLHQAAFAIVYRGQWIALIVV